jgi:hypothetical protein
MNDEFHASWRTLRQENSFEKARSGWETTAADKCKTRHQTTLTPGY